MTTCEVSSASPLALHPGAALAGARRLMPTDTGWWGGSVSGQGRADWVWKGSGSAEVPLLFPDAFPGPPNVILGSQNQFSSQNQCIKPLVYMAVLQYRWLV